MSGTAAAPAAAAPASTSAAPASTVTSTGSGSTSGGSRNSLSGPTGSGSVSIERMGWLEKRGGIRKSWKKRWFVLRDGELKYYASDKKNTKESGNIILDGCQVEIAPEAKYSRKFCFELNSPLQNRVFVIVAENGTSLQEWMNAIRRAMLRILRDKAKTVAANRKKERLSITGASGDAAKNGDSVGATVGVQMDETKHRSSVSGNTSPPAPPAQSAAADGAMRFGPGKDHRGEGDNHKFDVYLQWLEEQNKDKDSRLQRKPGQVLEADAPPNEGGLCCPGSRCIIM